MSQIKSTAWSGLSKTWKIMLISLAIVLYIVIPGSSLIVLALVILKFDWPGLTAFRRRFGRYSRRMFTLRPKDR
jgi:hypothetical protein